MGVRADGEGVLEEGDLFREDGPIAAQAVGKALLRVSLGGEGEGQFARFAFRLGEARGEEALALLRLVCAAIGGGECDPAGEGGLSKDRGGVGYMSVRF